MFKDKDNSLFLCLSKQHQQMIYFFNPGHETAVLNASPYYTAPASIASMQCELAFLPAWYAHKNDVVLVPELMSEYYEWLISNLGKLPKPVLKKELRKMKGESLSLWGVSPQGIHYFREINKEFETDVEPPLWHDSYTYLNSRQSAKECLAELIKSMPEISDSIVPQFLTSLDSIENLVNETAFQLLAKAPYSSSGRGLLWLPVGGLTRVERQILQGILNKQGIVSVERALDKQLDFAMEFMTDGKGKAHFVGYSLFETNKKGAYQGNYLASQIEIENKLTCKISKALLEGVKSQLETILSEKCASIYEGCIGVDMLIYKEGEEYRLQPCIEINMRYNMGYLALQFTENYLVESSCGYFYIDFSPKEGEILSRHQQMMDEYPATFEDNRLKSGYLSLCQVSEGNHYRAYVIVK